MAALSILEVKVMKYSAANPPIQCMMTQSTCYRQTYKMNVLGVLIHSTGANNPTIRRYVQPDDDDPNREELLEIIGVNRNKNDWNHKEVQAGLNAWIGKLANGSVAAVQTMPWNFRPWGCGSGSRGSCNSGWIQFEICEDGLDDEEYFNQIYLEACELVTYLCKLHNSDPHGTVRFGGIDVPTILCHKDSYQLGLGSGHADVLHWFPKFGKSMDDVRDDVAALIKENEDTEVEEEDDDDVVRYERLSDIPTGSHFQDIINDLMTAKIINGNGDDPDGNNDYIDLSHDMVRMFVFEYRAGVYDNALERAGLDPDAYKPKALR